MSLYGTLQAFQQDAVIAVYEIDTTNKGGSIFRFFVGTNELKQPLIWQGNEYTPLPMKIEGFEMSGSNFPRLKLQLANVSGTFSALVQNMNDLVGCKVTRKRTLARYLDAANFSDGNPNANPNEHFPDDVYYVVRKTQENKVYIEFELGSSLDLDGVKLPRRQVIAGICPFVYRDERCGYAGPPVAKKDDSFTDDPALDACSHKVNGCKRRFGEDGDLRFGGFPGSALVDRT